MSLLYSGSDIPWKQVCRIAMLENKIPTNVEIEVDDTSE